MILLGLLGGIAVAAALTVLLEFGFYFVVLVPALGAMAIYRLVSVVIERGHCRSKFTAVLVGIPIGLAAYLGYFQGQLAWNWGWEGLYRIDQLPKVIWMNWETQVFVRRGKAGAPGELQFIANVIIFFFELLLFVIAAMVGGYRASSRVYSEEEQRWAQLITKIVPAMWGPEIEPSVRANDFAELLKLVEPLPVPDPKRPPPRTIMSLEFLNDGEVPEAYLSVSHVPKWTTVIVSQMRLTTDEFHACRPLFLPGR